MYMLLFFVIMLTDSLKAKKLDRVSCQASVGVRRLERPTPTSRT